jgi:hypothetical protein
LSEKLRGSIIATHRGGLTEVARAAATDQLFCVVQLALAHIGCKC